MIIRYIYGLRGLLMMLALLTGSACLYGTTLFLLHTGNPGAPLPVAWGLVATSGLLVLIVGLIWAYSLIYWRHAIKTLDHLYAAEQIVGRLSVTTNA